MKAITKKQERQAARRMAIYLILNPALQHAIDIGYHHKPADLAMAVVRALEDNGYTIVKSRSKHATL